MVDGSSRLEVGNNKQATARGSRFLGIVFVDDTCERPLLFPLVFSRAVSSFSDVQITTHNTYVKDQLMSTHESTH